MTEIQDMKTIGPKPKIFANPNLCLGVRARGGGGAVHQVPGRAAGARVPEGGEAQLRAVGVGPGPAPGCDNQPLH